MRRAKLILPAKSNADILLGSDAKLVDAETGEEIKCIGDIRVLCPLNGLITANVDVQISEIEIVPRCE